MSQMTVPTARQGTEGDLWVGWGTVFWPSVPPNSHSLLPSSPEEAHSVWQRRGEGSATLSGATLLQCIASTSSIIMSFISVVLKPPNRYILTPT